MTKYIDSQLRHAQSFFSRLPREVLADGDRVASSFPTLLLLTWHPRGMCLVDIDSTTRLRTLTSLMAKGVLPLGFIGTDKNLELVGLLPLLEFRDAQWALRLLHQAYCERACRRRTSGMPDEGGALIEERFPRLREIDHSEILDTTIA
jgi:hypothetical protein